MPRKDKIEVFVTENEKSAISSALNKAEKITGSKSKGLNLELICLEFLRLMHRTEHMSKTANP